MRGGSSSRTVLRPGCSRCSPATHVPPATSRYPVSKKKGNFRNIIRNHNFIDLCFFFCQIESCIIMIYIRMQCLLNLFDIVQNTVKIYRDRGYNLVRRQGRLNKLHKIQPQLLRWSPVICQWMQPQPICPVVSGYDWGQAVHEVPLFTCCDYNGSRRIFLHLVFNKAFDTIHHVFLSTPAAAAWS